MKKLVQSYDDYITQTSDQIAFYRKLTISISLKCGLCFGYLLSVTFLYSKLFAHWFDKIIKDCH
jgi:hypothetical protein